MLRLLVDELDEISKTKDISVFEKLFIAGISVTFCSQHLKQAADPIRKGVSFKNTR